LDKHTDQDTVQSDWGPNRKHYLRLYMGFGFIVGASDDDMPVKYGNSVEFPIGLRYKYRLNQRFSVGADLGFRVQWYRLKQDSSKKLPTPVQYDRELFNPGYVELHPYLRINLDKHRGNVIGKFIDLGAGLSIPVQKRYVQEYKEEPNGFRVLKTYRRLDFYESLQAHAYMRVGVKWFIVYAHYRLTPMFDESKMKSYFGGAAQLPNLSMGVQVNF